MAWVVILQAVEFSCTIDDVDWSKTIAYTWLKGIYWHFIFMIFGSFTSYSLLSIIEQTAIEMLVDFEPSSKIFQRLLQSSKSNPLFRTKRGIGLLLR